MMNTEDENEHVVEYHWGVWVDSETPITGVVSNNTPEYLYDEEYIDLAYEEYVDETLANMDLTDDERDAEIEAYDSGGYVLCLLGSWVKDESTRLYEPDKSGEYAAIMREDVTQVVWSVYTKRSALCSPCYPGQGDLDTLGSFLTYDLPPDIYGRAKE
jgi:hypothetical protein